MGPLGSDIATRMSRTPALDNSDRSIPIIEMHMYLPEILAPINIG
jgi:hypothetical protein